MIDAVESLLRDVTAAAAARQLYAPDHPRYREVIDRVVAQVIDLTTSLGEVAVFQLDQRLVWRGTPLPNGESLARGFFTVLTAQGYQRWSVRRGITADEMSGFVTAVADAMRSPDAPPLSSSPHVRLSSIDAAPGDAMPAALGISHDEHVALAGVWRGVMDERKLQFDVLEMLSLSLARTIEQNVAAAYQLSAMTSHDDYTVVHITNVALLAMALAEAVGLPSSLVRETGTAALLHDVGKLRVPADVLNAPGRLSEKQRALIRRHPEDGARILMATPGASDLCVTVAYEHHVQYDGGGYPTVPRGWRVNLVSAITHVVDVFDALRSDRPYRKGLSVSRIAEMMGRDSGTVFDPALIDVFFDKVVPRTVTQPA